MSVLEVRVCLGQSLLTSPALYSSVLGEHRVAKLHIVFGEGGRSEARGGGKVDRKADTAQLMLRYSCLAAFLMKRRLLCKCN